MKTTTQQKTRAEKHRLLMTLLGKANFDDDQRHDLIYSWTAGRTRSTRELTDKELNDLIWKLQNDSQFAGNVHNAADAMNELATRKKRSQVLAIAQRVGIHEGKDFKKFNAFMTERSILKKKLSKYTLDELDKLIEQFRGIEANFKKSAENAGTKAWHEKYNIPMSSGN